MRQNNSSVLSVRLSGEERQLLENAAESAHTSVSDFVRRRGLEAAELQLLDTRSTIIPVADWEAFERWADAPAKAVPALEDLAARRPTWKT